MEYLERAFPCAKNLKSKAPRGGACGGEGAPRHLEVSLALRWIWDGDLHSRALEREGAHEGEGELVSERGREGVT